jgi:eukaryotic-like serine/threonine-protein kinase
MSERDVTPSFGAVSSLRDDDPLHRAQVTAAEIKRDWQRGVRADAEAALEGHPDLRRYRSLAIDLAHYEYRLRLQAGEGLEASEFCRRFPTLEQSLYLLIRMRSLLEHDPELQDLQQWVPWPKAGETFLGYRLVSELGRGAFGRVFLAHELALGNRQVALKVAIQGGDEAVVLGRLCHPNIVPVYSVHWDDATGLAAFCMPYLGRATLWDVLNCAFPEGEPPTRASMILDAIRSANEGIDLSESPRPERLLRSGSYVDGVIYLAARLADALAHSHRRGICHRDLKPSNVLLSPDGQPLLLDFNLSVDVGLPACRVGGTLPYMAPEVLADVLGQTSGTSKRHHDPRSDLFSLGVILYEILTGVLPFGEISREVSLEESARQLREQQVRGPKPLQEKNRRVDHRLAELVHCCLTFDPDGRPQTAGELTEGLRRELAPHRRGLRWVRDHRRRVRAAGSVLLMLVIAGIAYFALRPPYPVRQFERGMGYYGRGDYTSAIEYLNESLRADPKQSDALFVRGRALLQAGDVRMALEDFHAASLLTPDPKTDACVAHCLGTLHQHEAAIARYLQAIEKGFQSPGVFNNLGFSYRQLNRLDSAEEYLQRATAVDEQLAAAHHNLVLVYLNRAGAGRPVPESALVHARKAAELGPASAELYRNVAALFACAAKQRPELIQPAIRYLDNAVAHGLDPASLSANPRFSVLRDNAAFQALLAKPPGREPSAEPQYFVDPL